MTFFQFYPRKLTFLLVYGRKKHLREQVLFSTKFALRASEIFLRNVKYACSV